MNFRPQGIGRCCASRRAGFRPFAHSVVAIHSNKIERVHVLVQTCGAERHLLSRGNPPHVPTTAPMPGPRAAARTASRQRRKSSRAACGRLSRRACGCRKTFARSVDHRDGARIYLPQQQHKGVVACHRGGKGGQQREEGGGHAKVRHTNAYSNAETNSARGLGHKNHAECNLGTHPYLSGGLVSA